MEYYFASLKDQTYWYYNANSKAWSTKESEGTRFTMDERLVIEKYGFLKGGAFLKVRP